MRKFVLLLFMLLIGISACIASLRYQPVSAAPGDCTLVVPVDPLTAPGLATPYQLMAPCHESDTNVSAFVQGAILNADTGTISIYNPLVIDQGTTPLVQPTPPTLPAHSVVALWFGFNGGTLTLQNAPGCKQGMQQFAWCNADVFFQTVNTLGKTSIPPLGTANDGMPCPTVRDFSIVDQDQSDNLTTTYLTDVNGNTAQNTAANRAALAGTTTLKNPSDERLLTLVDKAIGCTPFMAPDLADGSTMVAALPLNELQAAAEQASPIAQIPAGDPFIQNNGQPNQQLLNRYRTGVDQTTTGLINASTTPYCQNLLAVASARLKSDQAVLTATPSPEPGVANSLFTFVAQRFVFTYEIGLNCMVLLQKPDPISVTQNDTGVIISATIN